MMLAFWRVLIVLGVVLLWWLGGNPTLFNSTDRETPDDILRRRYAAGEAAAEEYVHMRQVLEV